MNIKTNLLYTEFVVGPRKWSNVCWALILLLGTLGFLLTGLASYFGKNKLFFPYLFNNVLYFEPQGLLMCFYGIAGFFLSIYLWGMLIWNVGSGYNEIDRQKGIVCLFRWGFPGENRRIRVYCFIEDIKSIRIQTKNLFLSRYSIYLELKNKQSLPLNQMQDFIHFQQMEQKAAEIAQILQVPIEDL